MGVCCSAGFPACTVSVSALGGAYALVSTTMAAAFLFVQAGKPALQRIPLTPRTGNPATRTGRGTPPPTPPAARPAWRPPHPQPPGTAPPSAAPPPPAAGPAPAGTPA